MRSAAVRSVAVGLATLLAGCGGGYGLGDDPEDPSRASARAIGFVVADEPLAATAGQKVLEQGGSAADAAAAVGFTLAVTDPAAASLGGGGLCLYYDQGARQAHSIEFLPRTPKEGGPIALPGLVRGFAEMHAAWGELPWKATIEPAYRLASEGFTPGDAVRQRGAQAIMDAHFQNRTAQAAMLDLIREGGGEDFYKGEAARIWLEDARAAGAAFSEADLIRYRPRKKPPIAAVLADRTTFLPAVETGSGALLKDLWSELGRIGTLARNVNRQSALDVGAVSDAVSKSYQVPEAVPPDLGSTSFVIATRNGDAAVCGLTLNGVMGTGSFGAQSGVLFAHAHNRDVKGLAGAFLAPMVVVSNGQKSVTFAGAASGGPRAPAMVTYAALAQGLDPRDSLGAIEGHGYTLVNAVSCPTGIEKTPLLCRLASDPRGHGKAVEALGR